MLKKNLPEGAAYDGQSCRPLLLRDSMARNLSADEE